MFTKLNMAAKQHSVTRDYKCYQRLLIAVCIIGILVSWYAYHVETSKERDSGYIAFCDINSYISCSKAFTSRYRKNTPLSLSMSKVLVYSIIDYCTRNNFI